MNHLQEAKDWLDTALLSSSNASTEACALIAAGHALVALAEAGIERAEAVQIIGDVFKEGVTDDG